MENLKYETDRCGKQLGQASAHLQNNTRDEETS
jgi:hypothetical protein